MKWMKPLVVTYQEVVMSVPVGTRTTNCALQLFQDGIVATLPVVLQKALPNPAQQMNIPAVRVQGKPVTPLMKFQQIITPATPSVTHANILVIQRITTTKTIQLVPEHIPQKYVLLMTAQVVISPPVVTPIKAIMTQKMIAKPTMTVITAHFKMIAMSEVNQNHALKVNTQPATVRKRMATTSKKLKVAL